MRHVPVMGSATIDVIEYAGATMLKLGGVVTYGGDVFFASYLAWCLHEGRSVEASCRHAAQVAARHVQGKYIPNDCLRLETDYCRGAWLHQLR
jgi:hypothetical protein